MTDIRMLVFDVDGTLTNGRIYIGDHGEAMKAFDVKDGYGIAHLLPQAGITPVIITGRTSRIVEQRAQELGIADLHQGVADKLACLRELTAAKGLVPAQVAYFGDDLNDLDGMRYAGVSGCPADAVDEVRQIVDHVCVRDGGRGAAREFIEWLVRRRVKLR